MDLLRFTTAGSVDDGKSTLIGRLLYDSKSIFDDQYEAIKATSEKRGEDYVNLALLTDGLRAEREQGITIDVAYRYFATPRRKFIIADTPGHIQYTRNMVTGASSANLAIILIDARKGVIEQTQRHAIIASLLRIPHVVVCVNKMDLVDWSEARFEEIREEFEAFASKLEVVDVHFIPISALIGDNVGGSNNGAERYTNLPWPVNPSYGSGPNQTMPAGQPYLVTYLTRCNAARASIASEINDAQSYWAAGRMHQGPIISMMTPPNTKDADCTFYPAQAGMFAMRSRHAGGVNVMLADGSVRFVKSTVSVAAWWAIGTKAGNEALSSDSY